MPVDEFSFPLCIAGNEESKRLHCGKPPSNHPVFRGINTLRPEIEIGQMPDAAMHFVNMGAPPVYGIFRRNDQPTSGFKVWAIDKSFNELAAQMEAMRSQMAKSMQSLAGADLEDQPRAEGSSMYNALFPPGSRDGKEAQTEFEAFASLDLKAAPNPSTPRSIFVRIVGDDPASSLLPINLMALPISSDRSELLGLHYRIEQPLEIQSYQPSKECISHWVVH
jgi:hypothetical protein